MKSLKHLKVYAIYIKYSWKVVWEDLFLMKELDCSVTTFEKREFPE